MADDDGQARFRFLYRSDAGVIDRGAWWRGVITLGVPLLIATIVWIAIAPFAHRDLERGSALVDPAALAVYVYLLLYAFAVILIAVCYYNLSAKRFRARALTPGLAGLVPLATLLAGSTHWIVPRSEGMVPGWAALVADVVLAAVVAYTIWQLGLAADGASGTPDRR